MKHSLSLAGLLLGLLILAGCAASSGGIKSVTPIQTGRPVSFNSIQIVITSHLPDLETEKSWLSDHIISGLNDTKLFSNVTANKAEGSLADGIKVEAEIEKITRITDSARVWFGGLAGQARIVVQVTVSDLSSGNHIEAFEIEGSSGKSAMAGTTDEAVQRAAEQVVSAIVRLNAQNSL